MAKANRTGEEDWVCRVNGPGDRVRENVTFEQRLEGVSHDDRRRKSILDEWTEGKLMQGQSPLVWSTPGTFRCDLKRLLV